MYPASTHELGPLGIRHIKRFWSRSLAQRTGGAIEHDPADWVADNTLLSGLRIGLRETFLYLFEDAPTLEQFEAWVLEKNGGAIDPGRIAHLNAALAGEAGIAEAPVPHSDSASGNPLTPEDLAFWDEHGYVILHDAVPPLQCDAAAQAIYAFTGV